MYVYASSFSVFILPPGPALRDNPHTPSFRVYLYSHLMKQTDRWKIWGWRLAANIIDIGHNNVRRSIAVCK